MVEILFVGKKTNKKNTLFQFLTKVASSETIFVWSEFGHMLWYISIKNRDRPKVYPGFQTPDVTPVFSFH